ncbi:uncharacterized protein LOC110835714 [Zootermopsis nevadensis]|uniref:uncharacterized protein LOC110835714 n=1 Tax=Zootermopsis nevadensis TaxID=136037 RepID=UPI000B8E827B|nr:uncharacterized protein LOC110835714 [Zootermopsis nevadensis]
MLGCVTISVVAWFVLIPADGAPTTVLPPGVVLQLEDTQEALNQTNAEPCTVAGAEYNHGQQVPREDPCEFCLCLDGELFCWWQDRLCLRYGLQGRPCFYLCPETRYSVVLHGLPQSRPEP